MKNNTENPRLLQDSLEKLKLQFNSTKLAINIFLNSKQYSKIVYNTSYILTVLGVTIPLLYILEATPITLLLIPTICFGFMRGVEFPLELLSKIPRVKKFFIKHGVLEIAKSQIEWSENADKIVCWKVDDNNFGTITNLEDQYKNFNRYVVAHNSGRNTVSKIDDGATNQAIYDLIENK